MDEIYKLIEYNIKSSGYQGHIDGLRIYNEISDEIEDKENGIYIFMVKKEDDLYFEYKVEVMDADFNLSYIDIHEGERIYHVDFD